MYNTGSGPLVSVTVCPSGWSDRSCQIDPSLSHCSKSSSSSSPMSSGAASSSSRSLEDDACALDPSLCASSSGVGGSSGSTGSSGSSGPDQEGVTCADLGGCDWADLKNQIKHIGLTARQLDALKDILERGLDIAQRIAKSEPFNSIRHFRLRYFGGWSGAGSRGKMGRSVRDRGGSALIL